MRIIGFGFTKISIEKKKDIFDELKVSNEVNILGIEEVKQDLLKSKEDVLGVKFRYVSNYTPDIAKIEMEGSILASMDPKLAKDVLKGWKDKDTPDEFKIPLFNTIFRKAGLKALELEDEMNLPLHMQMPSLRKSEGSSK
jgi:hypothetical protein